MRERQLKALRREIEIGLEQANQGKVKPFTERTVEGIKARGRMRHRQRRPK